MFIAIARLLLTLGTAAGIVASIYVGMRVRELADVPNSGLAIYALITPLGIALLLTAVSVSGLGIMLEVARLRVQVRG